MFRIIRHHVTVWAVSALFAIGVVPAAKAQAVANAQIHGVVSDATGAVISGAQVKATQTETGQVRTTVSAADGSFVLPNLSVGHYNLEVTSQAFQTYVQTGIILQVGNNVQVNVALTVGAVSQELRVSADAAMVETQDTSISEVMDNRRIIDLPLNGRQATDLILLSGGSVMPPNAASKVVTSHDYPLSIGVSVSGGAINGNNYLLDGGDHNDSHSNINLPFPFPDALQEFSVQTNGVAARYGLHPGSVVNVVTKSGSNQFHGDLFEFVRNGDFNARNFFAPTQDSLRRNQFGGVIGGPVRKDKLFLFSGVQVTRIRTAPPQNIAFTPTQAVLNGDFSTIESGACQSNGRPITLLDPANNNQPFPNNQISPTRFSTPSVGLLKWIPVAANPCGRIVYSSPNPSNDNQYIGRADWVQSAKHSIYGRYFIVDFDNPPYFTDNILTTTRSGLEDRTQSVTLADQYNISPSIANSFHATYARLAINRAVSQQMPNPVSLGVNMFNFNPHYIDLAVSNKFSMGGGSNAPAFFIRNQWQWADDLDVIRGRHHMTFGFEYIAIQMNELNLSIGNGEFTFNGSITNDPIADFLIGRPSLMTDANPSQIGLREKYAGVYGQDDFQVTKRLNLHVGLRWEPFLPEHDIAGRGQYFSLPAFISGQKTSQYTNAPPGLLYHGDPGIPAAYVKSSYLGFAPRFGFAWDPTGTGKTSVRASYGVFLDSPESYTMRDWASSPPWGNQINDPAPVGGFVNPYQGFQGGNPFPTPFPPGKNAPFNLSGGFVNAPLNAAHPYMQQWDLSLQRQVGENWLLTAAYLGNKSTHMRSSDEENPAIYGGPASNLTNTNQRRLLSQINPAAGAYFATITLMDTGINTSYNGLRLSAQHRFSRNFTVLSVYTYSHCLQNGEPFGNRVTGNQYQNPFSRNSDKAVCDYDLRHAFVNSFVWESPRFSDRAVNMLLGNWTFSFLLSAHTGFAFFPVTGVDASLTGVGQDRPNVVGQPYMKNTGSLQWLNTASFSPNLPGTYGNAGYNSLIAPGYVDIDSNLTRLFKIRESHRLELRFEFFNVLNHTNFAAPINNLRSSTFGLLQSANDPRILQFALKYSF